MRSGVLKASLASLGIIGAAPATAGADGTLEVPCQSRAMFLNDTQKHCDDGSGGSFLENGGFVRMITVPFNIRLIQADKQGAGR